MSLAGQGRGVALATYYRITWQLLILLVSGLAVGAGVVRPLAALPFLVASAWVMTPPAGRLPLVWRRRLSFLLGTALLGLGLHEVLRIDRFEDLVPAMLEVLCGFLPVVLMTHERPRSYWLGALTVVVVAVGSISVTTSVVVYVTFLAFIAVLLLNMNAANLRSAGPGAVSELPRGYFRQFLLTVPTGALAAVTIFLAFPRVESFTMSLGRLVAKSRSGYSGLVTLSGEGEIDASPALALLVDAVDKDRLRRRASTLRLRGDALDTFDGLHWSTRVFRFTSIDRSPDLRVASRHQPETQQLQIHVEPQASTAVFYPDVLLGAGPLSPGAGRLLVNGNGSLVRDVFNVERFHYGVRTALALPVDELPPEPIARLAAAARAALAGEADEADEARGAKADRPSPAFALTAADARLDLAVPASVGEAPWFKAWVAEVGVDPERDTLAAVEAKVDRHFATKFEASLANRFSGGGSSLEAFLTTDRRGHCEYFATATALLLRSLGLPTRVLVGYRGGTYNELIDMLEVREENAHAWVEAYVPGVGWHELDPTPVGTAAATESLGARLRLYVNAASFWFHQYVIDYDQSRQRELLHSLKSLGDARHDKSKGNGAWLDALKDRGRPLAALTLVAVFAVFAVRLARRRGPASDLPPWYRLFVRRVGAAGHVRGRGETHRAFLARLRTAGVDRATVDLVAAALERQLYAGQPQSAEEAEALRDQVARLQVSRGA